MLGSMNTAPILDREEYVEQSYFFRTFRDRLADNMPAQEVLERVHEEILSTTRLPLAIQFLATELKHTGLLGSGLLRLPHYFTAFQTSVIDQAEQAWHRMRMPAAPLTLERLCGYMADKATRPGPGGYQFEAIRRNRPGYDEGPASMGADPVYGQPWREYFAIVRRQLGAIDLRGLISVRSELYVSDARRRDPRYAPRVPPLFAAKE